jgi:hypothetical protein
MSSVVGDADVPPFFYFHRVNQSVTEAASALMVSLPLNDGTAMSAHERNALGSAGPSILHGPVPVASPAIRMAALTRLIGLLGLGPSVVWHLT